MLFFWRGCGSNLMRMSRRGCEWCFEDLFFFFVLRHSFLRLYIYLFFVYTFSFYVQHALFIACTFCTQCTTLRMTIAVGNACPWTCISYTLLKMHLLDWTFRMSSCHLFPAPTWRCAKLTVGSQHEGGENDILGIPSSSSIPKPASKSSVYVCTNHPTL